MSKDRDDYLKKQAEAQFAVKESELVEEVCKVHRFVMVRSGRPCNLQMT